MSRKSESSTTNQNSNTKTIPEMTWDEILALPAQNIPNKKVTEYLKKEIAKKKK